MPDQRLNVAVVMDPIEDIKYAKDTTLAMLLAAQRRGCDACLPRARRPLAARRRGPGSRPTRSRCATTPATGSPWASPPDAPLGEFDVILMRKDPPFDTEFIYTTYILERAAERRRAGGEPAAGPARHEREGVHGLVPGVLRADADHARHGRHGRVPARARPRRLQAAVRHGRPLDLRARRGRQERQRGVRDAHRIRHALRDRAALPARDRRDRRHARPPGGRRAGAVRAGPHALRHRQPRQPGRRRQGCRPAARRARPLARRDASGRRCASAACCSSGST